MLKILGIIPAFIKAIFSIIGSKPLRRRAVIPAIIGFASLVCLLIVSFYLLDDFSEMILGLIRSDSVYLRYVISAIILPLELLLSALLAFIITLSLAAVFIESFISASFKKLGANSLIEDSGQSILTGALRGATDSIFLLTYLLLITLISILLSFAPPLLLLSPIFAAFGIGFDIFDTTLANRGLRFKDRFAILKKQIPEATALGAATMLIFLIPLGGVLFISVPYYVAAARVVNWGVLEDRPSADDPNSQPKN